ncbi:MAG TPA: DUF2461 domain-containing protein [Acidimicrobiales bacterium]|nr:DUF2461 domain-containing protein [Acidimicrobiales bacterium]
MAFKGWQPAAFEFFEDLEEDNSKSFWQSHQAVYEASVKAPMEDLLSELGAEFGPGRLFRPYRDVRFSKDKSPYKTNIAATVGGHGYVSLWAGGIAAGAGMHMMAPDQLERFRQAVAEEGSGPQLEALVARIVEQGYGCGPHESLKSAPKGYPKDHPRIELLKAKGITTWQQWPRAKWMGTAAAKERVGGVLRASAPLNDWLAAHVGQSQLADRGR